MCLVLPLAAGRSLAQDCSVRVEYVRGGGGVASELPLWLSAGGVLRVMRELAQGIMWLHDGRGILHRDSTF